MIMIIITIRRIYFFVRGGEMNSLGTVELYLFLGPVLYLKNIKWVTYVSLVLCLVAQSCPVPMDPPGSSVHGILQVKNNGVGCHALGDLPNLRDLPNLGIKPRSSQPRDLLNLGIEPGSSQPRDLPNLGIEPGSSQPRDRPNLGVEPRSSILQADSLPFETPGKPKSESCM